MYLMTAATMATIVCASSRAATTTIVGDASVACEALAALAAHKDDGVPVVAQRMRMQLAAGRRALLTVCGMTHGEHYIVRANHDLLADEHGVLE